MKSVIESYVGVWIILIFTLLSIAFLNIHLNVMQARRINNEIKTEVQATNGSFVPTNTDIYIYKSSDAGISYENGNFYEYDYTVERCSAVNNKDGGNSFIYNDVYKINLIYRYSVPLFGEQVYPITEYTY